MLLLNFIIPFFVILVAIISLIHLKRGPFFVPMYRGAVSDMIKMLRITTGDIAIDLGSGDGRVVIALAEAGAEAHGFEHNVLLVWWSRLRIRKKGLSGRAFIHRGNFWKIDFSKYSVITVFGISYIMSNLEKKVVKEARPGLKIATYTFHLPNYRPVLSKDGVRICQF